VGCSGGLLCAVMVHLVTVQATRAALICPGSCLCLQVMHLHCPTCSVSCSLVFRRSLTACTPCATCMRCPLGKCMQRQVYCQK
jgi:hypothetical protein